ncbi:calcium channel flower isoform X1 [Musca vetustissima]|uniref:calcium channel flower isoform X1 n=1 Tax=Musca vetustissima TaxID=27455 RepID=UPI002AB76459|nr:calcium channel flower isoform X1 [Musca vetustissima]
MSFAEKITSLMARPNQQPGPTDDQPWYFKYGVRFLGITGAFFCILFGLFNALSLLLLNVSCLIGGIIEILLGFLVMSLEAPCCFFCIDYVGQLADIADSRPMWNRAALYCVASVIPVVICFSLGSLFPCALVFATGVIYGMMSLGKKASAAEMRQAAVNSGLATTTQQPTTNDRAGIINNAQPFSFTGAVGTDSNV